MRKFAGPVLIACGGAFVWMGASRAQFGRGSGDWVTSGADAQRSSWVRSDPKISRDSLQKPGFQFLWKLTLAGDARQPVAVTPPIILDRYIGYRGFRSLGFVGSGSDGVFAIDTDLARIEWQKRLSPAAGRSGDSPPCGGGTTATLARPASAAFPTAAPARGGGGGRGRAARSDVGPPGEGAVTLREVAAARPAGPNPGRGGPGAPGAGRGGFVRRPNFVHALSSDGMLHSMYVSNGAEPVAPVKFLPPNANMVGLIVLEDVAYAATAPGCGGAPDAVWALELDSGQVATWKSNSGIAGSAGPALGPDGTLYAATTEGELVALEPKTLKVKDSYTSGKPGFASSPVIFEYKGKALIAAVTRDGAVHLLDSTALGGAGHQTPLYKTPAHSNAADSGPGALASWQDSAGTRWIVAPTAGSIVAWTVADENGAPALQPGWISRDMASPLPPMIDNGVVFAVAGSVLYALDGTTGRELWNSGRTITFSARGGGLSAGESQVYLGTNDGTLYAFGFPMER